MASYTSFEELDCYRKCRILRIKMYRLLKDHKIRDRDMIQNFSRAGRSTTRNIAEGFGRHSHKENIQYCRIARGSLHEILDDLNIFEDENFCKSSDLEELRKLVYQALKSVNGYISYLKKIK